MGNRFSLIGLLKTSETAFGRLGLKHKIINYEPITGEMAHDDEISLNTQCASQWDDQKIRCYYNGVRHTDDVVLSPEAHGIHRECKLHDSNGTALIYSHLDWCKQGVAGRGVLLDWPRWLEATSQEPISPIASHSERQPCPRLERVVHIETNSR